MATDPTAPANAEHPPQPVGNSGAGGCRRGLGCGCQVFVFCLVALVVVWLIWGEQLLRWAGTSVVEIAADTALNELGLPEDEQAPFEAILHEEFSQPVRDDVLSIEASGAALEAAVSSRAVALVALRGFRARWVDRSLPADEQAAARATIARFERGFLSGAIDWSALEQVAAIAAIKDPNPDAMIPYHAREDLTVAEVRSCVALLEAATVRGEVPLDGPPVDLEAAVRAAFREQMDQIRHPPTNGADGRSL